MAAKFTAKSGTVYKSKANAIRAMIASRLSVEKILKEGLSQAEVDNIKSVDKRYPKGEIDKVTGDWCPVGTTLEQKRAARKSTKKATGGSGNAAAGAKTGKMSQSPWCGAGSGSFTQ